MYTAFILAAMVVGGRANEALANRCLQRCRFHLAAVIYVTGVVWQLAGFTACLLLNSQS
jgi:hypothetical protein